MKRLKLIPIGIVAVVLLGAAVLIFLSCRGCGEEPQPLIKDGCKAADKKQTSTLLDRINPLKKTPTKADKLLEGWPAGTRIVEVTPHTETVYVAIPPTGEIQIPEDVTGVTVYEKPTRDWGLEFRPFLGAGADFKPKSEEEKISPAAVAGVDILNIWRVHTGPGVCVDSGAFSGVWTASVDVWRNVGARAGGGYGTNGGMGFAGVTVGIE